VPAGVVFEVVVSPAQGVEVLGVGVAAVGPVLDVIQFGAP
jgi:hypothetical protein